MFIRVEPALLREGRVLGGAAVLTYMALASHAYGRKNVCHPSLATLADLTGYDVRTIVRAVATLESAGWIERRKGGGRGASTVYTLLRRDPETGAQMSQFPGRNRGADVTFSEEPHGRESPENRGVVVMKTGVQMSHEEYNEEEGANGRAEFPVFGERPLVDEALAGTSRA